MEKKGNRSAQGSSKGLANDLSKKSQDVSNGKQWPRGSRRREPTGLSLAKSEPSRKPVPQRNRTTVDKRPKPRGAYSHDGLTTGTDYAGLTEPETAELGSVFVQGSKKQNISHLLKFHLAPRDPRSYAERGNHRLLGTHRHRYNKEHFLQANCQFVVNACGDYKQYMNNADALVNWDLIEQVNVQVSEYPSCPICLYPPVAAKMTRCGHIYCWSCILHYLALSDKTWRKCPICYEAIYKQDLKSVVSFLHPPLTVNDTITFKLMKKLRGALIAYPIDHSISAEENTLYNMSQIESHGIYSKLVVADRSQVIGIIERESSELRAQLLEDEDCPEKCFIEQAITLLRDREGFVMQSDNVSEALENMSLEEIDEDLDVLQPQSSCSGQQLAKHFFFYQASDGQHIYLHPVNVEMLVHTYGSLEYCPRVLTGKIVEKEGDSVTEEIRKKYRYLQHLPLTCQFEVAEIHLKPPVVSKETLHQFKDKLETRRKKRQLKARDEKRREKRIAEEENKKFLGKYPTPNIQIESHQHFPEFTPEAASSYKRTDSESTPPRSLSPVSSAPHVGSLNDSGISFAKMLTSAKPRPASAWPQLNTVRQEPLKIINVTGAKMNATFPARTRPQSDSECELDGDIPMPTPTQTFGDVIAMALEKAAPSNLEGEGGSGKKKKKKKQKLLLASSMVRPRD